MNNRNIGRWVASDDLSYVGASVFEMNLNLSCSVYDVIIRNDRSEEHTSELQSHSDLVCRLLLEKKKYYANPLKPLIYDLANPRLNRREDSSDSNMNAG